MDFPGAVAHLDWLAVLAAGGTIWAIWLLFSLSSATRGMAWDSNIRGATETTSSMPSIRVRVTIAAVASVLMATLLALVLSILQQVSDRSLQRSLAVVLLVCGIPAAYLLGAAEASGMRRRGLIRVAMLFLSMTSATAVLHLLTD